MLSGVLYPHPRCAPFLRSCMLSTFASECGGGWVYPCGDPPRVVTPQTKGKKVEETEMSSPPSRLGDLIAPLSCACNLSGPPSRPGGTSRGSSCSHGPWCRNSLQGNSLPPLIALLSFRSSRNSRINSLNLCTLREGCLVCLGVRTCCTNCQGIFCRGSSLSHTDRKSGGGSKPPALPSPGAKTSWGVLGGTLPLHYGSPGKSFHTLRTPLGGSPLKFFLGASDPP